MDRELKPCKRCGEQGIIIPLAGKHFGRPRRFSKCKGYVSPQQEALTGIKKKICKTEMLDTEEEAIAAWNGKT